LFFPLPQRKQEPAMSEKLATMTRMIESWKRRDADGFLACMTDDIEYYWHVGSKPVIGKEKMRKFLTNYGGAYDQKAWRVLNHAEKDDLLLVEGHEELYDVKHDRLIQQPFMQAMEFRGGLIAKLRDYYEPANLRAPSNDAANAATGA